MSRRGPLSEEEQALWSAFVRSITPLRPGKATPKPSPGKREALNQPRPPARHEAPPQPPPQRPPPVKSPPLAPLERRLKQRVARGSESIEARIDLHGMTQRQAHEALLAFLRRAQANGKKIALVVTGKGARRAAHDDVAERGVLRRQVPLWLALPEFRSFVVGFDAAHVSHGGEGALYVRVRRLR
jgi:DNA-nicking Smr family endonuclease